MRFLMFDRVYEFQPYKYIIAVKNVSINEGFFENHFERKAIMPGALVFESIAQICGYLINWSEGFRYNVVFLVMTDARIYRNILPGDQMRIKGEMVSFRPEASVTKGSATVDGELVASVDWMVFGHNIIAEKEQWEREKRRFIYLSNYPLE